MTPEERRAFIVEHTTVGSAPLVPEIRLHIGGASMSLWESAALADQRPAVPPPYWAWPWPGGQALARYLLDQPEVVRGLNVADIGAGGGIVAIAAALAGATTVTAIDIEPFAISACQLNAELNDQRLETSERDPLDRPGAPAATGTNGRPATNGGPGPDGPNEPWDVILAGDTWYEPELGARMSAWLGGLAARGALVLTGDLGRTHLPTAGLVELARYTVQTDLDLEDAESKVVRVMRLEAT